MQMYEEMNQPSYTDGIAVDIGSMVEKVWKGMKEYWMQLVLLIIVITGGIFGGLSFRYTPVYEAKATYVITKTGDAAVDALITGRLSASFASVLANSGLYEEIAAEYSSGTAKGIPGTIRVVNTPSSNMMSVTVQSDNYRNTNDIMEAFTKVYPAYASKSAGTVDMSLIDKKQATEAAVNPFPFWKNICMGILAGAAAGVVLLLISSFAKKTVHKDSDMKKIVNLDCLAYIPVVKDKKRSKHLNQQKLITNKRIPEGFKQSVYSAQLRIENRMKKEECQTLVVTGSVPQEGKTTFSVNLAAALAESGKNVVLVDGDLRNPSAASMLDLKGAAAGLAEILEGKQPLQEIILDKAPGFSVLCAGMAGGNISMGLTGEKMREILDYLKAHYDYVVIDTPPSAIFTDAAILSENVDAAVYMVRQDYADVKSVEEGVDLIANTGVKMLGYVLNCTHAGISDYGKYSYRYGRYAGYGKKYGSSGKED